MVAHVSRFSPRLDTPYPLPQAAVDAYRRHGFVKLKLVFSRDELAFLESAISARVLERTTALASVPMEQRSTYDKAFLQVTNLWTEDEHVRELVFGLRLARIATELMGTRGVRLYHDQALYKEPGGGRTPWHCDQYYWPLATPHCVTAWIPLQPTPLEMGPVAFAKGSHKLDLGRDLPIGDDSEKATRQALLARKLPDMEAPFALGEVSFHAGWTFHHAAKNETSRMRKVMTVIYIDADMHLAAPKNDAQGQDWKRFCPGARVGELIQTPLNPVVYLA